MREKNEDICCQKMQKRDLGPRRSYSLFIGNKGGRFYLQGLSHHVLLSKWTRTVAEDSVRSL